ncbi:MAG: DUF362 domain-containing protein [Bacteroidetes bacterium]|nr:DUF362 domain-containing protein [Bacteroidota bacterium]
MDRRKFLKSSIGAGIIAGAVGQFGKLSNILAGTPQEEVKKEFDLVAVKGGEPDVMFDKGIASLGGMKSFVKKGQTVCVKPNIGWDKTPEYAANTHPKLVKRIIESCFEAGASDVYVFDNTCDEWRGCYENSGIQKAVEEAGGKLVPGNDEKYYREVQVPNGKRLKTAKVHEKVLDSDVFINVPVLKSHGGARLTISMKNLMGVVWDRRFWHRNDLHQCIADYATFERKPDLNVVDCYGVMMQNGPRGVSVKDVKFFKSLLISKDMVAVDAAATKLFGMEVDDVSYINIAHEMKVGNKNLDSLNINRLKV